MTEQIDAVRAYLQGCFPGKQIEERASHGHRFKVYLDNGGTLLLSLSHEWLEDHSPDRVTHLLSQWGVAELLQRDSSQQLAITNDGLTFSPRD